MAEVKKLKRVNEIGLRYVYQILKSESQYGSVYQDFDQNDMAIHNLAKEADDNVMRGGKPLFTLRDHETLSREERFTKYPNKVLTNKQQ